VRTNSIEKMLGAFLLASMLILSACGGEGDSDPHPSTTASSFKTSPGTGVLAVDCTLQRAYIPLNTADVNGNGQVSVIDLTVNPDVTDPRVATVSLTHPDMPSGTAFDNDHSLIIVVSGKSSGVDGFVDLIDEKTNTLVAGSPFAFPAGSQSGYFGQALYDSTNHLAILATCDSATCSSGNALTGFVTFNTMTHAFGTIVAANYPEAFAFNNKTNLIIDASDNDSSGQIGGIDQANARACTLTDTNVGSDNDGSSFDNSTGIVVVSNEATNATVINLNQSSFAPGSGSPCTLNEGGTPPNSVLVTGLPDETAGSAVDPDNHWAFLISDGSSGMALLTLPTEPVAQLVDADITAVSSSFPNDPTGSGWGT
jgi:hypothetical protein